MYEYHCKPSSRGVSVASEPRSVSRSRSTPMSITLNREYDFSQSEHLAQEIESTPHIRGRRITVRDIGALVHKRKLAPATIADGCRSRSARILPSEP